MAKEKFTKLILGLCLIASSLSVHADGAAAKPEVLTLERAIARAIAANRQIQTARITLKQQEIAYDNAWDTMFMPVISLKLDSTSSATFAHLPKSSAPGAPETDEHSYPVSSVGVGLGSYTLFNFWKDWYVYEQARVEWVRQKEKLAETVRVQKFEAVLNFYRYKTDLEKLDAAQRSITLSEAILELVKSRFRLKKATDRDVDSSGVDVLNARNEYYQQLTASKAQLYALNQTLGDPIETPYQIDEKVKYFPFRMTPADAVRIFYEHGPSIRDFRKDIRKAELGSKLASADRLPLPKISFSGVNLAYTNGYYGTSSTFQSAPQGNANLDVTAAVNFTIPLTGPGGLFNTRTVQLANLTVEQADLNYTIAATADESTIYQTIQQIQQTELLISNNRLVLEKSSTILDTLLSQLSNSSISRLELRDALLQARSVELQLNDSVVTHLTAKLLLARTIGVDKLPGDSF